MTALTFTARKIADASKAGAQCAIVPLFSGKKPGAAGRQLDKASSGSISAALKLGDFTGKTGETLLLPGTAGAKRLLLVGAGTEGKFNAEAGRAFTRTLVRALATTTAGDATLHLGDLHLANTEACEYLEQLARGVTTARYRYTETVSTPKSPMKLNKLTINIEGSLSAAAAKKALHQGHSIGLGVNEARNLANLPGNICTPSYLAQQARKLGRANANLKVSVLEEKKMKELGMGSLLSVSAGSDQPAKLIVMEYKGAKADQKPYVLIGKGITFDSGGISLKPGAKMDEMKFDMGGAASVFGTMRAITGLQPAINVVAIVAAAENMPSGGATKPGDVVTSMSGKTIEVLNTDAEGRLVLCDALTHAERYKPKAVIDIATLTGACVVALGSHATGLFANQDKLAEQLLEAGIATHDRAWRMPLWDDYKNQLKSNFADLPNIGGPGGGSITAACFLSEFATNYDWAHLDIAGSAWDSSPKGATGRPVALLTRYLMDRS